MPSDLFMLFRIAHDASGLTQEKVAKEAGIKQQPYQRYLAGKTGLSTDTLIRIAKIININPAFITGDSAYKFKNEDDELIKMFIKEFFMFHSLEPLYSIISDNDQLSLVFLVAPLKGFQKIKNINPLQDPVYAVFVKGQDNNAYLLRRKNPQELILLAGDFKQALNRIVEISSASRKTIAFSKTEMSENLYSKIQAWTVKKNDIEQFLSKCGLSSEEFIYLSDKENLMVKNLRSEGIDAISFDEIYLLKKVRKKQKNPLDIAKSLD